MLVKGKLSLSASAIKTYEQCHRKYFYSYVERPDIERKKWPHLELGNFVHDVLEKFHNVLMVEPNQNWAELMSESCKSLVKKYNLTKENRQTAKEMLKSYLLKLEETGLPDVMANEQYFKFKLDDDLVLKGYIDRIDKEEHEGEVRYHLQDYKSGKSKYLDEFQLLVYGLYLLREYPDLERFKGSYIALAEDSKFISYNFTRTDLDRTADKIKKVANDIRNDQTWGPSTSFLCNYCDFNQICPSSPCRIASGERRAWDE